MSERVVDEGQSWASDIIGVLSGVGLYSVLIFLVKPASVDPKRAHASVALAMPVRSLDSPGQWVPEGCGSAGSGRRKRG